MVLIFYNFLLALSSIASNYKDWKLQNDLMEPKPIVELHAF